MATPLQDQISALRTPGQWVNLSGLVVCALQYLSTRQDNPEAPAPVECTSISLLGYGMYNYVYRLTFSSGLHLAASIPKADEEDFFPAARLSEITTVKFVAESGLYPDIPVPRIHAWQIGFDNPAGAPWTLMDVVSGVEIDSEHAQGRGMGVSEFDILPEQKQMGVVQALATLKANLSKPVPFNEIGSIYPCEMSKTGLKVGPLTTFNQRNYHESLGGPYASSSHLYTALLQRSMVNAMRNWCSLPTDAILDPKYPSRTDLTPRTFSDIFHMLTALIPHFEIPPSTSTLVLHHPDIALRNVLFDEQSLKDGTPHITGVIDWAGAQVLPLMLTAIYPGDIMSNTSTPFTPPVLQKPAQRPDAPFWLTVPFNWTSVGNSDDWPRSFIDGVTISDQRPALAAQIRRYYLRTYFSACYATRMQDIYADADLARASVFREAEYYLKFHEVLCDHPTNWERYESWVKETYWRLRLTEKPGGRRVQPIVGPNVYHAPVERPVRDLRMLKQEQDRWVQAVGETEETNSSSERDSESDDTDEEEEEAASGATE